MNKNTLSQKSVFVRRMSYFLTIIFSVILLFVGNRMTTYRFQVADLGAENKPFEAKVVEIVDRQTAEQTIGESAPSEGVTIIFFCRALGGRLAGQTITAMQTNDGFMAVHQKEVEVGDHVLIDRSQNVYAQHEWELREYVRTGPIFVLGAVFFLFLLLFGRGKGLNTIISLVLTCVAIFGVFIPSILTGHNIYLWSMMISLYVIVMTLMIVNGPDKKSLAAIVGCLGGIFSSGVLVILMDYFLRLTGMVDEDSTFLLLFNPDKPIDLKAIIFAAIIIGALGAIMDVAMSISSALFELFENVSDMSFQSVYRSGINIGRDIMGTMSNTLILAYIGSSLSVVLLLIAYNYSMVALLNREMIIVEMLQALIGSIGILFTIPLTSIVCAFLFTSRHKK